ncbi:MAG TPA: hypothetical protein VGL00_17595, partial [Terracidiphilus sp.]
PSMTTGTHRLICPKCKRSAMRRVGRHGFLEKKIFPLFGFYPWECGSCRIVKLFKNRGSRRTRTRRTETPTE